MTRRPLILQLVNIPSSKPKDSPDDGRREAEWGEFLHIPNRRFYDFDEIRREIESETSRIAGNNKGINRLPINLKVFSPHVLNLTLVDLPGLTKIPIGDQPTDIEKQTRALILEYIAKPNSIILAVSPANVDLVNSESLKLARQVDSQGKRTIGVLTKLDLMDQGTNAIDILSGHVYPLKLGFIGVVNRSQQDIQDRKSLGDSLQSEREFFESHPVYKNIAHKCGTAFLAKTLNQTLMAHIRERLPDIKARLNTLMGQTEQELASYGDAKWFSPANRGPLILQLMTKFAASFISSIEGTAGDISTKELCGGARIYYIYNDVFGQSLTKIDPVGTLSYSDVRTAIRNSTGPRPSLFVPELAFDLLVKPQIKLLEGPSQRCVELVYEELMKICHNCGSPELARFPKLQGKLIEVISDLLRERLGPTSSYVSSLIDIQRAYINTNHPDFLGAASAMSAVLEERQAHEKKAKEAHAAALAKRLTSPGSEEAVTDAHSLNGDVPDEAKHGKHRHSRGGANGVAHSGSSGVLNGDVTPTLGAAGFGHHQPRGDAQKDSFLNYFFGKDGPDSKGASQLSGDASPSVRNPATSDLGLGLNPQASSDPFSFREMDGALDPETANLSEREILECELIRRLISSYFDIVRQTIQDQVPKAVMHLLVNFSKEEAQNRLVSELYKESLFDELLYEDENLAQERQKCENMLKTYKEAARVVGEVV